MLNGVVTSIDVKMVARVKRVVRSAYADLDLLEGSARVSVYTLMRP